MLAIPSPKVSKTNSKTNFQKMCAQRFDTFSDLRKKRMTTVKKKSFGVMTQCSNNIKIYTFWSTLFETKASGIPS